MEFIIWVETRLDGRTLQVRQVAKIERTASGIDPEEVGLTLQDGKTVLKQVQERIVRAQVELISVAWRECMPRWQALGHVAAAAHGAETQHA